MSFGYDSRAAARGDEGPSVLLLAPLYPPAFRGGGPIRTTEAMVETHGDRYRFYVISSDTDWGESKALGVPTDTWVVRDKASVLYARKRHLGSLIRALWQGSRLNPDFVYINSFLDPKFSILPMLLSKFRIFGNAVMVVAPRGEFGTAALAKKALKKKVFLIASRLTRLHSGVIWHASSEVEAGEIRTYQPRAAVVVRLNESILPLTAMRCPSSGTDNVHLIFVSRISEIKGVTLLLEALGQVEVGVTLKIYGTAQNSAYLRRCEELASRLPSNVDVVFCGGVENSKVRGLFAEADAFFLPTEHENFGHAIAESLSAGCPTFVEDVTPWTDVIMDGGGRIVANHTVDAWSAELKDYCSLPRSVRSRMKSEAADAYERWRAEQEGPSVFDIIAKSALGV